MRKTVELDIAQATLSELIAGLSPGDEVVIVQNQKVVAKLLSSSGAREPRKPGLMQGRLTVVSEDDEHLEDFRDYMPRTI